MLPLPRTVSGIPGRPGRPSDFAEEVDLLPKGQADLLQARQWPGLQRTARCLCAAGLRPQGACDLCRLHPTVVS